MKIALIVPYFGTFPNYFNLFLKSCEKNVDFEWLIFTDNEVDYDYPKNVIKIPMKFEECQKLIKSKFDFDVFINNYNKLCDYKAAYGYIFDKYLEGYDFWGHCDVDLIFGDLSKFITTKILSEHDKIFSLGHLTIYRNTEDNNRTFMNKLNDKYRYVEVFTSRTGCAFDEWCPNSINDIYLESGRPFLKNCNCADVNPYRSAFVLDILDPEERVYSFSEAKNNVFKWENGKIIRHFKKDGKIQSEEHIYVHLQKRKMQNFVDFPIDSFYIVPNKFINSNNVDVSKLLSRSRKYVVLNTQYFKVKYKSLRSRIKKKNWKGFFSKQVKRG